MRLERNTTENSQNYSTTYTVYLTTMNLFVFASDSSPSSTTRNTEWRNENTCKIQKICCRNILRLSHVLCLLFSRLLCFSCFCNFWTKCYCKKVATLHYDISISEFLSQSTDLLRKTDSCSTSCHEHSQEDISSFLVIVVLNFFKKWVQKALLVLRTFQLYYK